MLTENASCFVELSPSDDGAKSSVADVGRGWGQTHRPDVVGEANGFLHAQDGNVIDKTRVNVSGVDEDVRNDPHLFVWRQQIRSPTKSSESGHPMVILGTVKGIINFLLHLGE